jgi:GNAT superfamily N-acetyltransferase
MNALLDNITWHTLNGPHARFSAGGSTARRYASGFSPIVGFADPARPDFEALRAHCASGEHFYCEGDGLVPAGWRVEAESTMFKMVWAGGEPAADGTLAAQPLGPAHADAAVALATLTKPGPFGPRTVELGEYFGVFDECSGELVAMAGERMCAGPLREVSGVCTHPSHQGRGLARRLMHLLIARQRARGETPFLHVMRDNAGARALYQRMGFAPYREVVVRVVAPC